MSHKEWTFTSNLAVVDILLYIVICEQESAAVRARHTAANRIIYYCGGHSGSKTKEEFTYL